jgi:uncharacterized metal-binding protein YceD (DUF177 family)
MKEILTVPMNGLASGRTEFRWYAGKAFFAQFENSEILDADLMVDAVVEKSGDYIGVDCEIDGSLTVLCDRCLEDLVMPVSTGFMLSVKFGAETAESEEEMEEGREIVYLKEGEGVLDLCQIVYDYACLSLPIQRFHEAGGCNSVVMQYLNPQVVQESAESCAATPFASLKDLMNKE